MVLVMLDAVAKHVDSSALGYLTLQTGQEPAPCRAVLAQGDRVGRRGLSLFEEGRKLNQVHAVLAVVVLRVTAYPADTVVGWPLARQARLRRLVGLARERSDV